MHIHLYVVSSHSLHPQSSILNTAKCEVEEEEEDCP